MPVDRRRRFAKACDTCRKRKLRCDGTRPVCGRCHQLSISCHYADVHKPAASRRRNTETDQPPIEGHTVPHPDEHIIGRSNNDSSNSVLPPASDIRIRNASRNTRAQSTRSTVPTCENGWSAVSVSTPRTEVANTPRSNSDTIVGGSADMRFFGPPAGISLVPIGTASQQSDNSSRHNVQPAPSKESWSAWTHPSIRSSFEKRTKRPLPSWSDAFSLVTEFFNEEHKAFPCFHPPTFMLLLGQQYSVGSADNPAWWASFNAVLAIVVRRRVERGRCPASDESLAWDYAANALGTALDILMRNTQLISVQALLTIAWFFLGTPNPQPSFIFVGSALRLAHSIGLHKADCNSSLGPIEHEMRTKVFWIALSLDRELCLRTGRPPAHDLGDFNVDLPTNLLADDSEVITTMNGASLKLSRAQAQLAVIQGLIYRRLYSSSSSKDARHVTDSIIELNKHLEEWCASLGDAFLPGQPIQSGEHPGLLRLCYSYYNCVIITNRAHGREYWMALNATTIPDMPVGVKASIQSCSGAARAIAALLSAAPREWTSFHWDTISINSSAAIILSINILRQPILKTTEEDLRAVFDIIQLFAALDKGKSDTYLPQVRKACEELHRMARQASRTARQQSLSSSQRQDTGLQSIAEEVPPVRGNTGPQSAMTSHLSSVDIVPATPWAAGVESGLGVEPPMHTGGYHPSIWPQIEMATDPASIQWSLDMLWNGPFVPLY